MTCRTFKNDLIINKKIYNFCSCHGLIYFENPGQFTTLEN